MNGITRVVNLTTVTIFIIAFLLGYGTAARLVYSESLMATEDSMEEEGEIAADKVGPSLAQIGSTMLDGINTVTAQDQSAGMKVAVVAKLTKEGWVVVHEDAAGKPGRILGAQLFTTGTHSGNVDLLRATMKGGKYYAMLHADDGDRKFDHVKDLPLATDAGTPIMDEFMAIDAGATTQ